MSEFKEIVEKILNEAKNVGILYHVTNLAGLIGILKSDTIHSQRPGGISFSRDKNNWYDDGNFAIIVDSTKLSNNHKLDPYSWTTYHPEWADPKHGAKDHQSETRLLPRGMKPVNKEDMVFGDVFSDTVFELPDLHKYIIGLRVNLNNYTDDWNCCVPKQYANKIYNFEHYINFGVNFFNMYYPNLPIEIVDTNLRNGERISS